MGTSDNDILWVDGDGSTRLYHPDGSNTWMSAMDDGQDSSSYASSQYTLTTRHGVQVIFDNTGRHIQTKNRAEQITTFVWVDSVSLDSVLLPPSGSGKAFKVQYTSGRMSGVVVGGRNIIDTVDVSGGPPELTRWVWPDGTSMRFGYESHHKLTYSVYSDADYVWLHYDTLGLVHISDIYCNKPNNPDTNFTAITLFTPWQEFGHADTTLSEQTAADTAGAYTSIKGPPIDTVTGDGPTTTFGIDRWGAPVYERDPYGTVMRYQRADANAPGLVSEIDFPNDRAVTFNYNMRGNPDSMIDRSWGSDSVPPQTTRWAYTQPNDYDSPSSVTAPDGTTTTYTYNTLGLTATGNRSTQPHDVLRVQHVRKAGGAAHQRHGG